MDVKEAVSAARSYLATAFEEELLAPPSLEEVWFDDLTNEWCVTLGMRRRKASGVPMADALHLLTEHIDYKVVRISNSEGKPMSIRNREPSVH